MTDATKLLDIVDASIDSILPDLIESRHDIHAHPELGYNEKRTSKVIHDFLDESSIEYVSGLAKGTGVLAHL